jgi:hypothetical protein
MAAMDIRKARALAEQLIMSGQNDGLTREDLVQQIIAKAEGAGAPGTAIGAALMGAQPRTVTPATPAPMQPGVPLIGPKPTAQLMPTPRPPPMAPPQAAPPQAPQPQAQELPVAAAPQQAAPERRAPQSSYRQALASTREQIAQVQTALAAMPPGQDNILERTRLQTSLQILNERAANLEGEALATENAQLPEEIQTALANREASAVRREERIEKARANLPFDALIAAGAALAQGRNGESLVEALSRGLQAGTEQYDRSRQGIEKNIENLAEAREDMVLKRYNALKQAQNEARDVIRSGREYDEKTLALANLTEGLTQKIATGQSTLDVAKGQAALVKPTLETALANARKAAVGAQYAEEETLADIDYKRSAAEENRSRRGERAREMTANQEYNAEQNFIAANEKMQEALEEYKADYEQAGGNKASMDAAKYAKYKAALKRREDMRRAFEKTFKRPPGGAGAMLLPDGTSAAPAAGQGRGAPSRTAITADPLGIRR